MDRITDRPDMTSAVYCGRKASTRTNKATNEYQDQTASIKRTLIKVLGLHLSEAHLYEIRLITANA